MRVAARLREGEVSGVSQDRNLPQVGLEVQFPRKFQRIRKTEGKVVAWINVRPRKVVVQLETNRRVLIQRLTVLQWLIGNPV